jgi:hypothetical protein
MKPTRWIVLAALLLGPGCLNLPQAPPPEKAKPVAAAAQEAPPLPPVSPEGITEANARDRARALLEELRRERAAHPIDPDED